MFRINPDPYVLKYTHKNYLSSYQAKIQHIPVLKPSLFIDACTKFQNRFKNKFKDMAINFLDMADNEI